jgi:cell shape-determining protein MreD
MNYLAPITLVLVAYLVVFLESSLGRVSELLGMSIKLLPGLMVYCGLTCGPGTLALLAMLAGLWTDSLSANPLGVTILPLFAIGLLVHHCRELILREQAYAQFVLGVIANAVFPLLTLTLLFMLGRRPLFGLITLFPSALAAVVGGGATILFFRLFDRLALAFSYKPLPESSFRSDREIKRGRA